MTSNKSYIVLKDGVKVFETVSRESAERREKAIEKDGHKAQIVVSFS